MTATGDQMSQFVIFSDIDGTLIDLESYDFSETAGTVAAVVARGIPLVLCSSKTRAEQEVLRHALGITDPYIVENGSAVIIPAGSLPSTLPHQAAHDEVIIELGVPAATIRSALVAARSETGLDVQGFSDLSVAAVASATGLDEAAAARARQREYSETITTPLTTSELARLRDAMAVQGVRIVSGGRFYTVTGAGSDKGKAVARLAERYRQQYGDITTIGLGDSANDQPMLRSVDQAYLVQNPAGVWQEMDVPGLRRVTAVGPRGWRLVIEELLKL